MTKIKILRTTLFCLFAAFLITFAAMHLGSFLVVDRPSRADVMVVLSGDVNDVRFRHGLELLRLGYARELILDTDGWTRYGRSDADLAREFISAVAPDKRAQLHICTFSGNSTQFELREISPCLRTIAPDATTAILVTSTFHTRRALSVAQYVLPQYRWSIAAAPDGGAFNTSWWRRREWAKTTLTEWQKLLWWSLVEQWSAHR